MEEYSGNSGNASNISNISHSLEPFTPNSQYNKISDSLRRVAPPTIACSIFCGGRKCKYEKGSYWPPDALAIKGIYSHWINEDLIAMSRPNTSVIQEYNVLEQFQRLGIKSVINLEVPGEHSSCSLNPLESSGFSYDPQIFMENGIYFYNYGWRDYGEASLALLLDMVKVLSFAVTEGKVGIHCHAGLGRTGVLIASYLVYAQRLRANEAIRFVRSKRPGSIQSRLHILIVQQFEQFLLPNCVIFCNRDLLKDRKLQDFTIQQYLKRQRVILHGEESKTLRYIPKILNVIIERLLSLCSVGNIIPIELNEEDENIPVVIPATPDTPVSHTFANQIPEENSHSCSTPSTTTLTSHIGNDTQYKIEDVIDGFLWDHVNMPEGLARFIRQYRLELNQKGIGSWIRLSNEKNIYVLTGLFYYWLEHLRHPLFGSEELTIIVLHTNNLKETLHRLSKDVSTTISYICNSFAKLKPSQYHLILLLRRLSAALTHRIVISTLDYPINVGYHSIIPEKSKPRKLSDGTLKKVMEVLGGIVQQYSQNIPKNQI